MHRVRDASLYFTTKSYISIPLAGFDYVQVVNDVISIGSSPFLYSYTLLADQLNEQSEDFLLQLSVPAGVTNVNVNNAQNTLTVTILDDDCKGLNLLIRQSNHFCLLQCYHFPS